MANHPSAWKRYLQSEKRKVRNRAAKSALSTQLKKAKSEIASGAAKPNEGAIRSAVQALAKSAQKGLLHKKSASRRISRLMKQAATLSK